MMKILVVVVVMVILLGDLRAQNPIFHNRLGSLADLANSVVGPGLTSWGTGAGIPAFVPEGDDGAVTMSPQLGPTGTYRRLLRLDAPGLLNAERGTVAVVVRVLDLPVYSGITLPEANWNLLRLFRGELAGGDIGFDLHANPPLPGVSVYNFGAGVYFTRAATPPFPPVSAVRNNLVADVQSWLHLAAVWDRSGIDGSADTLRLYVNGLLAAATSDPAWISTFGGTFDIGGSVGNGSGRYWIDDIKIWDVAVTVFSPTFRLDIMPGFSPGSLVIADSFGNPFYSLINLFTFDSANANGGLGSGWVNGLHISLEEALSQVFSLSAPFTMNATPYGSAFYQVAGNVVAPLSGFTIYGVALSIHPFTYDVGRISEPIAFTFP